MSVGAVGTADFAALFGPDPVDAGVVAVARSEPMDAPTLAVAVVPELTVTMLGDAGGGNALLVVRQYGAAVALIELGDGYLLDIDRARASVLLSNSLTGLNTTIWGEDAAMTLSDGAAPARFWGNVTFALDNGAVITAATVRREDNPMVYVLDTLTVTKRSAAVIITDIATAFAEQEAEATLTVTTARNGQAVEHRTPDGLVLEQDGQRDGWLRENTGVAADADWLAQTAPGALHGPEADRMSGREFGRSVGEMVAQLSRHPMIYATPPSVLVSNALRADADRRAEDSADHASDRASERRRIYLDSLRSHAFRDVVETAARPIQ
ncbi:DUF1521 domain-containing protein [uncultured Sphingomonas sp.]|uniref:DUF1521 domain-containing protein n=1 Tax=uncultured Sphingomonas sp. TaxID=158754 RepID=UPI0035CA590E